jgi:hypothetical protein
MPDRCQGCGCLKGKPRVVFARRQSYGVETVERVEGPVVSLKKVRLADFGTRWLCGSCAGMARSHNGHLGRAHLTTLD